MRKRSTLVTWLYLMPREIDLLTQPAGTGEHAALLRHIATKVSRGVVWLTPGELIEVEMAAQRGAREPQFKALLAAVARGVAYPSEGSVIWAIIALAFLLCWASLCGGKGWL